MSVWGVIFLGLLGVFFYMQAVTLFPDLHFNEDEEMKILSEPYVFYIEYTNNKYFSVTSWSRSTQKRQDNVGLLQECTWSP